MGIISPKFTLKRVVVGSISVVVDADTAKAICKAHPDAKVKRYNPHKALKAPVYPVREIPVEEYAMY